MKKGYKMLLVFIVITLAILLLNNFVLRILDGYIKVAFIVLLLGIFRLLFNFEKDRHRYTKTICLEIIIFLLIYFLVYYLSGLIFSFYRPLNYYTVNGIVNTIIPIVLGIVFTELLRYFVLCKAEGSKLLVVLTCILFILLDLLGVYSLSSFKTPYDSFMFLALSLLPSISKNVLCTYISRKVGYKPAILYSLVMSLYVYLLPLIPNPNQYIYALFQLIAPFILLYRLYIFFKIERDEDVAIIRNKNRIIALIPAIVIVIVLAYFTSGYFHYHAIVIGSGSMTPSILKGDVVVVEKVDTNYGSIEVGDVLAARVDNIIVVHRVIKIIKIDDQYYFYTKGDNNIDRDDYKITTDMVYGVVVFRIPYIGIPTVWLNNL